MGERKTRASHRPARVVITIRVYPESEAKIQALAEAEDRTFSDMGRVLLAEAITARTGRS